METKELITALHRMQVETGSLVCLGCGHEHACSTHGCAIIREAAGMLESLDKRYQCCHQLCPNDVQILTKEG